MVNLRIVLSRFPKPRTNWNQPIPVPLFNKESKLKIKFICARCGTLPPNGFAIKKRRFMRHGKTQMNLDSICIGSIDEPLCELGIKQAQEAADKFSLSDEKIDKIISSPLIRAWKTAEIFAAKLKVPLILSSYLRERNVGDIQGKPETPEGCSPLLLKYEYLPAGATPLAEFEKETASKLLNSLGEIRFGNDALLVTHSFRMRIIVKLIKGWNVEQITQYTAPANCQIITFGFGGPCPNCGSNFYEPQE